MDAYFFWVAQKGLSLGSCREDFWLPDTEALFL
jgi:hypothetical protein